MSLTLPTTAEYARLSWAARQEAARRANRALQAKRRRDRHHRDSVMVARAVVAEARDIFDSLPPEPAELVAARYEVLINDYDRHWPCRSVWQDPAAIEPPALAPPQVSEHNDEESAA